MIVAVTAAAAVLASTHPGSGRFTTLRGVYPIQGLRYLRTASGRGGLQFTAGAGAILLSGVDADEISPGRVRLRIDRMVALTTYTVEGACDASMPGDGRFTRIVCKGVLGRKREPFTATWTASGGEGA